LVSERVMLGYFVSGRIARTEVDSGLSGRADKIGLSMGTYFVAEMTPRVYLDGFLAVEASRNNLDLFKDALRIDGRYRAHSLMAGLSLSGVIEGERFELRPEVSASYGITHLGSLRLTAAELIGSEDLAPQGSSIWLATLRATPEIRIPLHDGNDAAHFIFAPSLVCNWVPDKRDCGGGLRLGLQGRSHDGASEFDVMVSGDWVGGTESLAARASLSYRF
jgi:hypothetical protein